MNTMPPAVAPLIPLTTFPDNTAQWKMDAPQPWAEIVRVMENPNSYTTKGDCHLLKLCSFGEARTDLNCLRHNKNVTSVGGIEVDYDAEKISVEDAVSRLTQARIRSVLYTSPSHTTSAPRWRILAPYSTPHVGATEEMNARRKQMVGRLNKIFDGHLANESFTMSQGFYFGRVDGSDYQAHAIDGDYIDTRDDLAVDIKSKDSDKTNAGFSGEFDMANCVAAINTGENYHRSTISIAMHLISTRVSRKDAIAQLQGIYQAARVINDTEKWKARYDAIETAVDSALEKNPPVTVASMFDVIAPQHTLMPVADTSPVSQVIDVSENGLAEIFADRNPQFRWVGERGKWMLWDGQRWDVDRRLHHMTEARAIAKAVARSCDTAREEKALKRASTINAIQNLAKSDPQMAATLDQWDTNRWAFNTAGGIVDLRTGVLQQHDPLQYMTKMSPVVPGGSCVRWFQFLQEVTGEDPLLINYLAKVAGLAMIGQVIEHKLFFFYGTGRNGKGVFINTLMYAFGDYATSSPAEMFMERQFEQHKTELADLRGARFVTASEVDKGGRWAEAKVKSLTGGDKIKARYMRGDFFEFDPQLTLIIIGNHKPKFRNVDEAIRGRFQMIPFTQFFPDTSNDKNLEETLKGEAGGILQWCIDGCLAYQREGLNPPPAVTEMTSEYLDEQDIIQQWIREECDRSADVCSDLPSLLKSWSDYAQSRRYSVGSKKELWARLKLAGFSKKRVAAGIVMDGLRVKLPVSPFSPVPPGPKMP